ncbi:hypothetical protein TEA_023516 [Camellia sinensis var. sinensis]|uniref:Uncharacterized protein n=1 Tax=Camellia sinensis var. sinensis TaxID=542762 RepID=A0A4S4DRV2_CAMSN|nr:hypothetical protein TEA_023516 [Camellia sinensis var. sinensis]
MTRRCSHCANDGHNSRTCPSRAGVKLFGVRLTDGGSIIKKSASMGNLSAHYHSSSSAAASPNPSSPSLDPIHDPLHLPDGYLSDDPAHATSSSNRRAQRKKVSHKLRHHSIDVLQLNVVVDFIASDQAMHFCLCVPKALHARNLYSRLPQNSAQSAHVVESKGVPWTEEEHRLFLLGLQKLGKGDWRGISRNFVTSRTPTQVASHAQKYFIRHTNASRRKRRSSLFDMVPEMGIDPPTLPEEQFALPPSEAVETDTSYSLLSLKLSLKPEFEPMEATSEDKFEEAEEGTMPLGENQTTVVPTSSFPVYLPVPFPHWLSSTGPPEEERAVDTSNHQVIRPIPILPKEPVNVDELVGMSQLSLGESGTGHIGSSKPLSLNLFGAPSRPSAFHASTPVNESD